MILRRIERGLAFLVAACLAALVLWPAGPHAEDLNLEVISVRELPAKERHPQRVEVRVRWQWLRPRPESRPWDVLAVSADPARWIVTQPGHGVGANDRLLSLLGEPVPWSGIQLEPGQGGEQTFVLSARGRSWDYDASAITLDVQYIHEAPQRFGWPGRSWVRSVGGTYTLGQGGNGQ